MISNTHKQLAQWAMDCARKNGCQGVRVNLYNGSSASFEIRDMKIDRLQQASESALSLHLFVDGRFGAYSTNRLDKRELETFIRNAVDSTRYLAEDRARTLPDASLYYRGGGSDLQLCDPAFDAIPPDDKLALAMHACEEIMGRDRRIVAAESSYGDGESCLYMIASNGFEGESSSSVFTLAASVSIRGDGDARPSSEWYDSALHYDKLVRDGIGARALERALRKLGQRKIASARLPMIADYTVSRHLLSPVISALYGSALQQKNSFLPDSLDRKALGDGMTLTDEPHLPQAAGARYFDGEGVATKKRPVFEAGTLRTCYIDTCYANKMGMAQTVDAPSILTMPPGKKDREGLIATLDRGILVTGFNGGNCNSTTGDFSYGIEGFLIENGQLTQPVNEMNITGNMLTLWNRLLETGNDPRISSSWRIPSLLFDGVDFSGASS
ncbi:MAG: TldD/PmbA family protein [Tannerella sp.]|jgi:PmbA protein|nr:TldD/PmbA family protein [Tannerella sp.]